MDFRTEWSSWILVLFMMIIAYIINPMDTSGSVVILAIQVVGMPLLSVAIACIPVLIYCYFVKVIPDIDYAIRLAFVYMLILLVRHYI